MTEIPALRDHLHEAIQASAAIPDVAGKDMVGHVLTGWVLVAEWVSPDGDKWISRFSGDARRLGAPAWQVMGYLADAMACLSKKVE